MKITSYLINNVSISCYETEDRAAANGLFDEFEEISSFDAEPCEDPTDDEMKDIRFRSALANIEVGEKFYCNFVGWMKRIS